MIRLALTGFAALLGLAFGSFLNVCLTRWPQEESIVKPRSHCRACGRTLAWWENIPLASWLVLRGRCRTCEAWIGWRYPIVELAVAALWMVAAWTSFSADPASLGELSNWVLAASRMVFAWLVVALAVLDAEYLWLPNWLTWPGIALGFLFHLWDFWLHSTQVLARYQAMTLRGQMMLSAALHWALGIAIAAAIVLVIRWTYWLFRRQEGMGLGDAKLMAMMAAWLGLPGAVLSFVLAVCAGAAFALVVLAMPRARRGAKTWATTPLPFGTFLCIAGIATALWGAQMIDAYLRWSGFR